MINVTLQDVFWSAERGEAWMVLADEKSGRAFSFFIGSWDSKVIAFGLRKNNPRPFTFNSFASALEALGAELAEVHITEKKGINFLAAALLGANGTEHRIDARPSDAVALAACMGRPIYVAETVMAEAGEPLTPEGTPADLPEGYVSMRWMWTNNPEET